MSDFNDDFDADQLADLADMSRKALREDAPEPVCPSAACRCNECWDGDYDRVNER